jgi:hypothetical protein
VESINFLINRVHTYPITKELNIIQDTLYNNKYNKNVNISHSINHKHNKNTSQQHQTTKWATFTYYGKEEITKLFKEILRLHFKQKAPYKT